MRLLVIKKRDDEGFLVRFVPAHLARISLFKIVMHHVSSSYPGDDLEVL